MSGRCNKLTGSAGAYNLYEAEIRADRIISNFDKIVEYLNTIKETQYEAYKTVSEIKDKISLLKSSVNSINSTLRSCELGVENVINGINDIKNISSNQHLMYFHLLLHSKCLSIAHIMLLQIPIMPDYIQCIPL